MANHLIDSSSLYLRKHISNPIDWWYWCDEALELAQQEDKPIFLSIGYSSCHWCTVMEGEAFSDLAIAEYLNDNFIPIKVDREERPDIDSIYMQALQMMIGQGGWPLNIFLTPGDLVPFYGGTYFPLEPKYNRPGFADILKAIHRFYKVEKEKLQHFKTEITNNLHSSAVLAVSDSEKLTKDLLIQGVDKNTGVISSSDPSRPCFPMIPYAQVALQGKKLREQLHHDSDRLARKRGLDLVLGGIYDRVGGGFHRYTVDATWTVPHFEKMLYDNGQILEYLANLWSTGFQKPAIEKAIAGTVEWLVREMLSPDGYFYAAQDADSFATTQDTEPEEGLFYVWNYQELADLLTPEELAQLQAEFTVTSQGNFEGSNVLQRLHDRELPSGLETILNRLFAVRYGESRQLVDSFPPAKNNQEALQKTWKGRIPPVTDTKMIVAWNSLVISGLARAYGVFGETQYKKLAVDAVNFIWQQQRSDNCLYRLNYDGKVAVFAQSEDYAFLIKALLDLYSACPEEIQWLDYAIELQTEFDRFFWNAESGGYYNNAQDREQNLLIKERSYIDNATPSANGVALTNLVRLALLTDNLAYRDRSEQGLRAFATIMEQSPQACPSLFIALDWFLQGTVVKTTPQQLTELIPDYFPTTTYRLSEDLPQDSVGLLCHSVSCLEPATDLEVLKKQIERVSS
ncbi:Thioredoxin domain containing protein [Hyella patelloides LEGE 07179]|uniref:Thioredoxin domain containing protein n=1 Tax=Hyella patelloides LEGE 07179 TaxID=945734 RepID=A0A563VXU4_9CYAN|nr:thioredoxin domain-containing protein [Hyella patelloides]VEP16274.1 Thioredoxin domain containing protein [Hyella patelloides LEGE 07179]